MDIDKQNLINALENESFTDFEDSVQNECSMQINADYIITRNKKDFLSSSITVLEPNEFLKLF